MKIETTVVTPALAKKWLALNKSNRPMRKNTVSLYADDMANGRWKLNGETIKLNGDRLIDGQHRLQACVQSGVSFVSVVVYDVDSDSFDTIDRGMVRSFGQILHIAGRKNAVLIASAARCLWHLETSRQFIGGGAISVGELEEVLLRYPEIDGIASKTTVLKTATRLIPPGFVCALWVVFARKDEELAASFFEDLDGGLNKYQPVTKLRQRMISDRMGKKKVLSREEVLVLTIKAWNAVRRGKEIGTLKWVKTDEMTEQRPLVE